MPDPGTILYVEDEESDVFFMRRAFEGEGLERSLQTVGDGQEAISYLSGEGIYGERERYPVPVLVLLDLNLPVVSGFEVLQWMRQGACKALPVVVFSSSPRPEDVLKARELGADDYVEKPNSAFRFQEVVRDLKERWLAH